MASEAKALARAESSWVPFHFNTQAFKYRSAMPALALDHSSWTWARMMLSGVIFDRQDFQVFRSIVVLDTVSVVDVLTLREASAKQAFHDDTVFKLEVSANTNRDITI